MECCWHEEVYLICPGTSTGTPTQEYCPVTMTSFMKYGWTASQSYLWVWMGSWCTYADLCVQTPSYFFLQFVVHTPHICRCVPGLSTGVRCPQIVCPPILILKHLNHPFKVGADGVHCPQRTDFYHLVDQIDFPSSTIRTKYQQRVKNLLNRRLMSCNLPARLFIITGLLIFFSVCQ